MSTATRTDAPPRGGTLGDSARRPDAGPKVQGRFSFSSDAWATNMLWGATLRSTHAHARIVAVDVSAALAINGVSCVLTADDVPGLPTYGLIDADQPVFARDVVRYVGEPIAAVAADHPETCRRALEAIRVEYEPLPTLTDPLRAADPATAPIHPRGNVLRHQRIRRGDPDATGPIVVEGTYEIGMQDQAFLGLEAALAMPDDDGAGLELYVATQWLHEDRKQIAACLALDPERVRLTLGGVGGAFGAREDISLQVHCALLCLRTRRPIKMQYGREESFLGHVHRHPARIWMRHHAERDGTLVKVEAKFWLDGGAYASTSSAVLINAITHAQGPYRCEHAIVDGWALRTNNPPCGAMRGFGVVQACFAHESQMDRVAAAAGLDPVEVRLRNAMHTGDRLITGQVVDSVAPVERCIRETAEIPLPAPLAPGADPLDLPGGSGLAAEQSRVRRGVGWGVSIKNLMYSEGFDDSSTARVQLSGGIATLEFATAEVGQGFLVLAQQIARTVLGVDRVVLAPIRTYVGSAGSTSASRQTWMSGGAVDGPAAHPRLARGRGAARRPHVGADRCEHDPVDAEHGARDLLGEHEEALTHFGSGELERRDAARELHPRGAGVVEALAVHEVLDRHAPADAAAHARLLGGQAGPARQVERVGTGRERRGQRDLGGLADAALDGRHAVDDLAGDEAVTGVHRVAQAHLHGVEACRRRDAVHLALVGEAGLHDAEAAHGAARRVVGPQGPAIDDRVLAAVRALCVGDRIDEHRG